jgi:N-acetylmuramoyl-L-alanine amidase
MKHSSVCGGIHGCDTVAMRRRSDACVASVVLSAAGLVLGFAVPSTAGQRAVARPLFEPGSCVLLAPTAGNRHRRVFIDAGHGGPDPGGVGRTTTGQTIGEAPVNVRVATDAAALLRRRGFSVVLSRTGPNEVARPTSGDLVGGVFTPTGSHRDLVARDLCADLAHANAVIGIDFNAAASTTAAGSVTLYDAVRPYANASLRLSTLVQRDVVASLRAEGTVVPDLGVHTDVGFGSALTQADQEYGHLVLLGPAKRGYLNTPTMAPAALIEPLFLTDPPEASVADSRAGQEAIARGLTDAAAQFFAR